MLFHQIEDANAILFSRGVFRQAKLFQRNGQLFAGVGSGFVRLCEKGGTSAPNITWVDLDIEFQVGLHGRLNLRSDTPVLKVASG